MATSVPPRHRTPTRGPATISPKPSPTVCSTNSKSVASLLSVPTDLSRRNSVESAFSESNASELSFRSTELGGPHNGGLIRTLSNVSSTIANMPAPSKWHSGLQTFWIANYGAFLVLSSQMFGCMMNISTRLLETPGTHGSPMHPFQILFVRQLVTTLITAVYALWFKPVPDFPIGPPGRIRWLLVSRAFGGFLGVCGLYFSLLYLPLSEATILTFLAPIGTCYAFSLLIPGETFSTHQQIASFISLFGVVLIARPVSLFNSFTPSSNLSDTKANLPGNGTSVVHETEPLTPTPAQHLQAIAIAMMGVVGAILAMTSIRAIGTRVHALITVNYFSALCTVVSLLALIILPNIAFRLPGNLIEWGLLSIIGFCGFFLQFLLTQGMAYGGPSTASKSRQEVTEADIEMQDHEEASRHINTTTSVASSLHRPVPHEAAQSITQTQPMPIKGTGTKATSMLYTQMLFALIADKLVFGVIPGLWSWIGSGFILFGAIWVAADGTRKVPSDEMPSGNLRNENIGHRHHINAREEEVGLLAGMDTTDADSAPEARSDQNDLSAIRRDTDH